MGISRKVSKMGRPRVAKSLRNSRKPATFILHFIINYLVIFFFFFYRTQLQLANPMLSAAVIAKLTANSVSKIFAGFVVTLRIYLIPMTMRFYAI